MDQCTRVHGIKQEVKTPEWIKNKRICLINWRKTYTTMTYNPRESHKNYWCAACTSHVPVTEGPQINNKYVLNDLCCCPEVQHVVLYRYSVTPNIDEILSCLSNNPVP